MQRERLTITLRPDLVQAADTLIDTHGIRNRSHAIEFLLQEGLGLHELKQAFLFFSPSWTQSQLERILALCAESSISELFVCLPAAEQARAAEVAAIATEAGSFSLTPVPLDFGSGGCLVLQKERLEHPFAMFWLDADLVLPESLLAPYLFHRQHQAPVTQLVTSDDAQSFRFAGLAFGRTELLQHIPAGIVSLEASVFPQLIKDAKVRAYAIRS